MVAFGQTVIKNPSGDCVADNDGGRPLYHSPGDSTYLPDCKNPLKREYWRVFARTDGGVGVIPRLDNTGLKYGLCPGVPNEEPNLDPELAQTMVQNCVCDNCGQDTVTRINNMTPEDALMITNALHHRLIFQYDEDGGSISPWAPDDDIVAACDLRLMEDSNHTDLSICQILRDMMTRWMNGEPIEEIAFIPSAADSEAIVPYLNKLYGITNDGALSEVTTAATAPVEPASGGVGVCAPTIVAVLLLIAAMVLA